MNHRQKKKQVKKKNKQLISRYPFLLPRNRWSDKVSEGYNYSYTELDAMPYGWRKAFGKLLLEELREELIKCNYLFDYRIAQIKEKYGALCWYSGPATGKSFEIVHKYELLSENICIDCGQPDVPALNFWGWTIPLCKKCYEERLHRLHYTRESAKVYEELQFHEDDGPMDKSRLIENISEENRADYLQTIEKIRSKKGCAI